MISTGRSRFWFTLVKVRNSCFEEFGVAGPVPPRDLDIYLVHLNFELIDDEERRTRYETIPTKLQLPREDVDDLVDLGLELLREEPEFEHLLLDLNAVFTN